MATTKVEAIKNKIDAARAKQKALEAELRKAEVNASKQERRLADRRKFILGNYLSKRMDEDEQFKREVMNDLARQLDRNVDRAVFQLPAIEEAPKRRVKKQAAVEEDPAPAAPAPFSEKPSPAQSFNEIVGQIGNS